MGRTTRTTKKPIKCNNTLKAMIIYNKDKTNNALQFIEDATPTNKELILFVRQGIIKLKGIIYISDENNLLSD